MSDGDFYVRYYIGHKGKYGHEFLEFEFQSNGLMRYANNSTYQQGMPLIRKEMYCSQQLLDELQHIIEESQVMKADDKLWPEPDKVGRQELEIVKGREHISFATTKISSINDTQDSEDPEGMKNFYYLVLDLKTLVFSMIDLHFRIKPTGHLRS